MNDVRIEAPRGQWWNMVYGAGYPDWLITSPLPPADEGQRWVWTGRMLVPLPSDLYQFWLNAHREPISVEQLREAFAPYVDVDKGEKMSELLQAIWKSGLFIKWPWGLVDPADTPEAIALQTNMVAKPQNPLPDVIPDSEWPGVIGIDRMIHLWSKAREHHPLPSGLRNFVQALLSDGLVWLVARPIREVSS
jgi:hypothetical protein